LADEFGLLWIYKDQAHPNFVPLMRARERADFPIDTTFAVRYNSKNGVVWVTPDSEVISGIFPIDLNEENLRFKKPPLYTELSSGLDIQGTLVRSLNSHGMDFAYFCRQMKARGYTTLRIEIREHDLPEEIFLEPSIHQATLVLNQTFVGNNDQLFIQMNKGITNLLPVFLQKYPFGFLGQFGEQFSLPPWIISSVREIGVRALVTAVQTMELLGDQPLTIYLHVLDRRLQKAKISPVNFEVQADWLQNRVVALEGEIAKLVKKYFTEKSAPWLYNTNGSQRIAMPISVHQPAAAPAASEKPEVRQEDIKALLSDDISASLGVRRRLEASGYMVYPLLMKGDDDVSDINELEVLANRFIQTNSEKTVYLEGYPEIEADFYIGLAVRELAANFRKNAKSRGVILLRRVKISNTRELLELVAWDLGGGMSDVELEKWRSDVERNERAQILDNHGRGLDLIAKFAYQTGLGSLLIESKGKAYLNEKSGVKGPSPSPITQGTRITARFLVAPRNPSSTSAAAPAIFAIEVHWARAYGQTLERLTSAGIESIRALILMYPDHFQKLSRDARRGSGEIQPISSKLGELAPPALQNLFGAVGEQIIHVVLTGVDYEVCHFETFKSLLAFQKAYRGSKMAYHLVDDLIGFEQRSGDVFWVEPPTERWVLIKQYFENAVSGNRVALEQLTKRSYLSAVMGAGINPFFYFDGKLLSKSFEGYPYEGTHVGEQSNRVYAEAHLFYWTSLNAMSMYLKALGKDLAAAPASFTLPNNRDRRAA
jgi:hypothetical protein